MSRGGMVHPCLDTTKDDHKETSRMIHCTPAESPQRTGQQKHARKTHTAFQPSSQSSRVPHSRIQSSSRLGLVLQPKPLHEAVGRGRESEEFWL
jgi:hypothetical protein